MLDNIFGRFLQVFDPSEAAVMGLELVRNGALGASVEVARAGVVEDLDGGEGTVGGVAGGEPEDEAVRKGTVMSLA